MMLSYSSELWLELAPGLGNHLWQTESKALTVNSQVQARCTREWAS
jgi:hypothetical protein